MTQILLLCFDLIIVKKLQILTKFDNGPDCLAAVPIETVKFVAVATSMWVVWKGLMKNNEKLNPVKAMGNVLIDSQLLYFITKL